MAERGRLEALRECMMSGVPLPPWWSSSINAVDLKNRFRYIETDCRNRLHDLAPPNRGRLNSTHIHGTHVPVEEPSTASTGDLQVFSEASSVRQDIQAITSKSGSATSQKFPVPNRAVTSPIWRRQGPGTL